MNEALNQLRDGMITFDDFARCTANDWNKLAGKMYVGWRRKLPVGVELNDLRQEMLVQAWIAATRTFEPERGVPLKSYVVFTACSKTLRWIHKQRGAKRRDDSAPSRHPLSFAEITKAGESFDYDIIGSIEDDLDTLIDQRNRFEQGLASAQGVDLYSLVAVRQAGGDIVRAGELLFDETALSLALRWSSPMCAIRQIEKSLTECCV